MSDNDNKYKYINKKQIDETSMPSIHKIRSLYESKINADQNSYPVYKKRPVTTSNSIKRSTFISKDESNNNLIRKDEKQSEKSNLNLDDFEDKNDKSEIIRGDNVYNYDMDTEEENYINNNSLKRKHSEEEYFEENEIQNDSNTEEEDYKDNVLLSYINDNDNSEEEEISDKGEQLNEKKTRLNYYSDEQNEDIVEKPVNDRNEYESSDSENLKEQNYEYDDIKKRKRQKTFDNSDNEVDNEEKYQYLNQEEDINNDNNNENVESGSPIKISEEPESVSKTDSNKLSGKTTSTPSKFRPFLFSNHFNSNDISVSGKHTLSKSSSSSSASSDSLNSNDSNNSKGLFGFKFSRKNSKVEDSDKKEESKLPRKNSASSKFSSFFHRTSSKTEKDQNTEAVSNNKNQIQKTNTIGTSTNNDAIDQDGVKRVPKRKRDSSDGENESDVELDRQKVKKIRLLEEEIKTIQQSIELKQQELRLQYDNLIKTRNSLSDPSKEPIPEFVRPSSMDFNNLPPIYPSKMGRPSTSSNFSRSSYYDYPFEIPSYPGEFDTSYASNDYRRFNSQRMSSASRMSMDDNGRYSFNPGPEDPSFYSNIDGGSKFNINPNRASNISSNTNPRFSNGSFYSKYEPSNYQNSYISPTSPQSSKSGLFSFLRRRKTPTPDSMYAPSNSMTSSFDQSQNPMNISGGNFNKLPTMDVSLTKPFYYYFIPLTRRKVVVHVDPLLRNAINYAKAAGNFECLKYLCEFEKIPNKYVDLRSIEEAAAHNDIDELRFLLKHTWFYDLKCHFIRLFKILFLLAIVGLILYCFNGLNEILIALFVTYVTLCVTYNWVNREK